MKNRSLVREHFDSLAESYDKYRSKRELHFSTLKKLLKSIIPLGKRVFEIGCGPGDLLVSVHPKFGYGMDISPGMIRVAKRKFSKFSMIRFSTKWPERRFDFIFMSDVVEHLEKPEEMFQKISKIMDSSAVFVNIMMNPVWEPVETIYNFFGWKMPEGPHKRLGFNELNSIVNRSGLKIVKHDYKLLMPIKIPFITKFVNKYLEKYFKRYAFIEYFVATKR